MATTITIDDDKLERFRRLKRKADERDDGVPDHTSDSFLSALMDNWEAAGGEYHTSNDNLVDLREISNKLDEIEAAAKEATEAAHSAERTVEELQR